MMRFVGLRRFAALKAKAAHGRFVFACRSTARRGVSGTVPQVPSIKEGMEVKVIHVHQRSAWPTIAAAGFVAATGVAALAYYSPETLGLGPTAEEIAAAEAAAAEDRRRAEENAREAAALQALHDELVKQEAAAAMKAAEEAKAAAEAEAAAAARREAKIEALRSSVETALEAVIAPGATSEAVEQLRSALQEASTGVVPADAPSMLEARSRLEELDQVNTARVELKIAEEELEEAMFTRVTQNCRAALAKIASAEATFAALGEDDRADASLVLRGQQELVEMERLDQEAARRAEAATALDAAICTREPEICRAALEEARNVKLAPCPAMELAEVLSDPERAYRIIAGEGADRILEDRRGLGADARAAGLDVEDFKVAAAASVAVLGREELQERATELAKALVQTHALRAREMEKELETLEGELRERMSARVGQALEHFTDQQNRAHAEKAALLQSAWEERTQEASKAAQAEVESYAEKRRQAHIEQVGVETTARIASAHEDFDRRYAALEEPLRVLTQIMGQGMTLHQRSQSSSTLSSALLGLQGALFEGRASHSELRTLQAAGSTDAFVAKLLSLLPTETVESSKKPVPTALQLTRSFQDQLGDFTSGAFWLPAKGVFTASLSRMASHIFSRLYMTRAEGVCGAGDPDVRRNLEVLTKASKFVERGELREALTLMEASLTGECRDKASGWMAETRNALLLHQVARALQAKARCLNALLA